MKLKIRRIFPLLFAEWCPECGKSFRWRWGWEVSERGVCAWGTWVRCGRCCPTRDSLMEIIRRYDRAVEAFRAACERDNW